MKNPIQEEIELVNYFRKASDYIDSIKTITKIREKVFMIKDLGIDYRWLDHWALKGLLLSSFDHHKWKKFCLIEYVWIKIILKIREFNIGLSIVSKVKEQLDYIFRANEAYKIPDIDFDELIIQFAPPDKQNDAKKILSEIAIKEKIEDTIFNILEFYIADILMTGSRYSILINSVGEVLILKHSYLELLSNIPEFKKMINGSFVAISITEILRDYIKEKEAFRDNKKRLALISEQEMIVLETIRQKGLKSVFIKYDDNNNINFLEETRTHKVDKATRLTELIMDKGYHDITIKTQKGDIVYCENKMKTMIQNKK